MHHLLEGMMHNSLNYHASTTVIQLQSILHYTRSITTLNVALKWLRRLNDARRVVWAIGRSFFLMYILFFIFLLLRSPRRLTAANDGQRRSTKAHSSQQRPMQAHENEKKPKRGPLGPR